ncbi:MAG: hypothetical protein QOJ19_4457 [Acidimicrobiia bacterium]|nr:hypothetical protein [Acidimicrobiia bacterium]
MASNSQSANPVAVRAAALVGLVGAAASAALGIVVQAAVQPWTAVSDDRWSYPWTPKQYVGFSLLGAAVDLLIAIGLVGFARSGIARSRRAARWGTGLAVAGTVALTVAQACSILVRDQPVDNGGAGAVSALFGAAAVLLAVGFVLAGVATWRHGAWTGWRAATPFAVGACALALVGLAPTKALPSAVSAFSLSLVALFIALDTHPAPTEGTLAERAVRNPATTRRAGTPADVTVA